MATATDKAPEGHESAEHDVKDWADRFLSVLAEAQPTHHKQLRPAQDT